MSGFYSQSQRGEIHIGIICTWPQCRKGFYSVICVCVWLYNEQRNKDMTLSEWEGNMNREQNAVLKGDKIIYKVNVY